MKNELELETFSILKEETIEPIVEETIELSIPFESQEELEALIKEHHLKLIRPESDSSQVQMRAMPVLPTSGTLVKRSIPGTKNSRRNQIWSAVLSLFPNKELTKYYSESGCLGLMHKIEYDTDCPVGTLFEEESPCGYNSSRSGANALPLSGFGYATEKINNKITLVSYTCKLYNRWNSFMWWTPRDPAQFTWIYWEVLK